MSRDGIRFFGLGAVLRLVTRITPPHRRAWAQAMLNELAYIESRGAAVRWVAGGVLFAIRERLVHELEKAIMNVRLLKAALVLAVAATGVVAGIYAIQKPYQQERIKIAVHRWLDADRA